MSRSGQENPIKGRKPDQAYMPKSKSDIHLTPDRVYDLIEENLGYKKEDMFDPCPVNPKFDGLRISWDEINYVNPPYSLLREFVHKAFNEADRYHYISIMLLPAKTDQQWFHDIVARGSIITWIQGRLKFKNHKHYATQPHFLVKIA